MHSLCHVHGMKEFSKQPCLKSDDGDNVGKQKQGCKRKYCVSKLSSRVDLTAVHVEGRIKHNWRGQQGPAKRAGRP